MQQNSPPETEVEGWMNTLGVTSLCQWDVLVFLYRHQTTLLGAEHLAHLLGYATELVVAALDVLESLELVERSRVSQGARLYKFPVSLVPARSEAFERLQVLIGHRAGRLLVYKQLRGGRTHEETLQAARRYLKKAQQRVQAARRYLEEAEQRVRVAQQQSQPREKRRQPWLKAI